MSTLSLAIPPLRSIYRTGLSEVNFMGHAYLLFQAEKFFPFIYCRGRNKEVQSISYLLGITYPDHRQGWVFKEVLD
ncbi:MAG: hypothetical protein ABIK53_09060 [bacterium]